MASQLPIHELAIADLRLNEDDELFADAVACVQTYWSQASQMTTESQEVMIRLIINRDYAHTDWSRKHTCNHRLYRASSGRDDVFAWPVFLILRALYKELPKAYVAAIRERNLPTALEDHTDDYLAVYPNTVLPTPYDTITAEGEAYRRAWPKLRNTPTIYRKEEQAAAASTASVAPSVPPVRRPSSALSSLSSTLSSAAPSAPSSTALGHHFPGTSVDLLSQSLFATTPATNHTSATFSAIPRPTSSMYPNTTTTSATSVAATTLPQVSQASQQRPRHLTFVEPEMQDVRAFQPARFIFAPASSTNLSERPAPMAPTATMTATPYTSTQTARQPQSMQPSVDTEVDDAHAEEDDNVSSAPSMRRKRGPTAPIPAMHPKKQSTSHDTVENMIQNLQSATTTSVKPKPSANAISRLEQRVDGLENRMMAVLAAMTNEILVLKEKVATLENA
ncbi:hypothetical protein CCMA1212_003632 [Trichoderma ghanense]|uniref:Uncharacterized protein n=1 Tax=Trichoderma ghanense TaxID=65468 RepID=A0ABY2H8K7_9HYPO